MADTMPGTRSPPASVRELGRTMLGMLRTRLELLAVEAAHERDRLTQLLVYGALSLLFLFLTLVLGVLLVVALFWESSYRLPAIAAALAVPALVAAGFAVALVQMIRSRRRPFDVTLRALGADLEALR